MRQHHRYSAFSLVEVTLALGVAGFCLIALFALLPVGMQTNQHAIAQTAAVSILSAVVADMRATSAQFSIVVPDDASSASGTTTLYIYDDGRVAPSAADARYRLIVTFQANSAGPKAARFADLKITWPAAADPTTTTPAGSVETFAAFDHH